MATLYYIVDSNNRVIRAVSDSGIITTVTLTSTDPVYIDNGGLIEPWGMVTDSLGNLYVCDFGTSVIYKIDTAFDVTTVAGTGAFGNSGDGGLATAAKLKNPWYVAVDAAGNLYIADASIIRIRAVNMQGTTQTLMGVSIPAGCIQTVAGTGTIGFSGDGGPAIAAELSAPIDLAISPTDGDLYIVDQTNNRVRKIDHTTGIITTVAGSNTPPATDGFSGDGGPATACEFGDPIGISFDAAGNYYIADTFNFRTRAVNTQGTTQTLFGVSIPAGCIDTVAGNGSDTFAGDGTPATTASIAKSWFTQIDPTTGDLYICDTYNYRIRKVDATTAIITTVAGNGTSGYTGDSGAATSAEISFVFAMNFVPAAPPTTGNIIIEKVTVPTGSSQSFSFTTDYGSPFSLLDGESNDSGQIAAGTYAVVEAPVAGWTTTTSQDPSAIVLGAGDTITVTFTNTQTRIIVQKVTDPPGSAQSFDYVASYSAPFSLTDGTSNDSGPLTAGTYSVSETPVSGWTTSVTTNPLGLDPASITLAAGDTVVVTFTNTQIVPPPAVPCGKALTRVDTWELDNGDPTWAASDSVPIAWYDSNLGQQKVGITRPIANGTIGLLYVQLAATLTGAGIAMTIPDDWTPYVLWGALADLFSHDGQAYDPLRAKYCEQRYQEGVELARLVLKGV